MEAAGVAFQMSSVAGAAAVSGVGRQFSGGGVVRVCSVKKSIPSMRFCGVAGGGNSNNSGSGFCDNGHVEYYNEAEQRKKEKELKSAKKTMKKKLKLIKGLSKNLSEFSDMGFGLADSGLTHQVKGKMISEAAELLLGQLQQLRVEEMELKTKKKEDKAKLKATRMMQKRMGKEDDSSSSSSSESECGEEVVDMNRLKIETPLASTSGLEQQQMAMSPLTPLSSNGGLKQQQMAINQESFNISNTEDEIRVLGNKILGENSSSSIDGNMMGLSLSRKKIEVCMGGKCKKSGAALLLEEFTKAVGGSEGGDVVGCKCMGNCRDGPNVRVVNNGEMDKNPLCIGVGLEDVGLIVSNFIGAGTGSNHLSELGSAQPQPAAAS